MTGWVGAATDWGRGLFKDLDRADALSLGMSFCALVVSFVTLLVTGELGRSQSTIGILAGFSSEAIGDANIALIRAEMSPVTMTELDFALFRESITPLSNQLMATAACMERDICDARIVGPVFCDRARQFEARYRPTLENAAREAGKPVPADAPIFDYAFYQQALSKCAKETP